jgi:Na+/melibiose symporter-like transporter
MFQPHETYTLISINPPSPQVLVLHSMLFILDSTTDIILIYYCSNNSEHSSNQSLCCVTCWARFSLAKVLLS